MSNRVLKKFDRQVYKYNPDQMIVRLNEIVEISNRRNYVIELADANSNRVLILGYQPDKTFGMKYWEKQGDNYITSTDA